MEATHLSCKAYPGLVDGNLATTGILKVKGIIEKDYIDSGGSGPIRYDDWLEGRFKAEALIQLDTLTPIAYIKVHPVSNIYRLSVDTTTTEIEHEKAYRFEPVSSHKIARSENGAVIHINIDRPARALRVIIYANRDLAHTTRNPLTHKTKVSFEDIMIREIQVYQ
jgi:hypothetical protein